MTAGTDPRREPDFAGRPEAVARRLADGARRGRGGDDGEPREMTFLDHLEELRGVLMHSVVATVAGAIGGWLLSPIVLEDIVRRTVKQAIVLSPLEAFNERIKLALVLGFCMALPIVLWRVWGFVVPGLFRRERRLILPMVMASCVLFAAGAAASYFYIVPLVVEVLRGFMTESVRAEIRLGALLGFVYNMSMATGIVCQLPLVTMTLTAIGLVTPGALMRQWRYAIVGSFLVTALITPGDVVTAQVVMGVPMTLLYFLSVGLSWLVAKRRRDAADAEEA